MRIRSALDGEDGAQVQHHLQVIGNKPDVYGITTKTVITLTTSLFLGLHLQRLLERRQRLLQQAPRRPREGQPPE